MNLNPHQYKFIFNTSFLSIGSFFYAIYNGYYVLSLCPGGVFLTSINYWRKPQYGWRRNLDMTYVFLAFNYQNYMAYRSQYMIQYYIIILLAICCYPFAKYYSKNHFFWRSAYMHCLLHIIANIANFILYSGKIYY